MLIENDELAKQNRKKKSRWTNDDDSTLKTSDDEENLDESHRNRERDYQRTSNRRSVERETTSLPEEEQVEFNSDDVVLDFYTSDLNLTFQPDCLAAETKSNDALCFLSAGSRTTFGFRRGKVFYEFRVTKRAKDEIFF